VIYRFDEFSLDTERLELRGTDGPVTLEPQVFSLLAILIAQRDRVVSKDELFEEIWQGRIVSDATLNSRINAARSAVGDSGKAQAVIRTYPKRGFRFIADVTGGEAERQSSAAEAAAGADLWAGPSIAVLPFLNISGDDEQEYFSDGITEDIITALARFRWLRVIARTSSFTYKGKAVTVMQVGQELGVRYVLEGSVRKAGERMRVTAQLIETESGGHIWAERYDRKLADIFALQDEITETILIALEPRIDAAERARARRKRPDDLNAWDAYQRGLWHFYRYLPDDNVTAKGLFEQAIATDPTFASAYAGLAASLFWEIILGYTEDQAATVAAGMTAARTSLRLDEEDPFAHLTLARLAMASGDYALALEEGNTALAFDQCLAQAHFVRGQATTMLGNTEQGLPDFGLAMNLGPQDPQLWGFEMWAGLSYLILGQGDQGLTLLKRSSQRPTQTFWGEALYAIGLAYQGQMAEAKEAKARLLEAKPDFSPAAIFHTFPNTPAAMRRILVEGLAKLGFEVPEV